MSDADWHSFREIDAELGLTKGTAFRAFKRVRDGLEEERDFVVLDAARDRTRIESLRRAGRIYAASVNVVLLGPRAADAVRRELGA